MARLPLAILMMMSALLVLPGCNSASENYYRRGIGTDLFYADLSQKTKLQDFYVDFICRQAGNPNGDCSGAWGSFVDAGMNDIDDRCDGYLAWLDNRRRNAAPIQQQIGDTQTLTQAVLVATGAGVTAIGVVGSAFGFARDTFENANARLLTEVNHSTVQTIVLGGQSRFRQELRNIDVGTRSQAIYVLRQYLRICMPFTIENEINTTLVTFQRGGAEGLRRLEREPLIDVRSIDRQVQTPRQAVARPAPLAPIDNSRFEAVVTNPNRTGRVAIQRALENICVPRGELADVNDRTVARVKAFQQWRKEIGGDRGGVVDGRLDAGDLAAASDGARCDTSKHRNYYEARTFTDGLEDPGLIEVMNEALPTDRRLPETASQLEIRGAIPLVRAKLASELELKGPGFSDQLTFDLVEKLQGER